MNDLERQLQYPLGETLPAPGTAIEVAAGVRWVRMGLPFALDHINLWLLRDEIGGRPGWTIVDCGIADEATRQAWERVFASGLDGLPVLRLIVTHMHPDHIGLAHWLTERWGVAMSISATDYHVAQGASTSATGSGGPLAADFMSHHGITDPRALDFVRARTDYFVHMVPALPPSFHRLMEGDALAIGGHGDGATPRTWTCHAGYGHAPEHIALHCPSLGVLISGDMVLPRISTNVSVFESEPESNPLALYLASIARLRALPEQTLVLPSHGRPFVGLRTRIDQLTQHHAERFAEVRVACAAAPQSATDLLPLLFKRPLDLHQTTFALGEAIAHLHALWFAGELERAVDAAGVYRFALAARR